jgi:hypothetical protein
MLSEFGTEVPGELGMTNQLSMASIQSIETLHRSGHSNREISRILGSIRVSCGFGMISFFGWGSHAGSRTVPGDSWIEEPVVGVAGDSEFGAAAGGCVCGASFRHKILLS